MDHVALDLATPNNRDLNDEILETGRLDAGQYRHLRTALDLKDAQRVRFWIMP